VTRLNPRDEGDVDENARFYGGNDDDGTGGGAEAAAPVAAVASLPLFQRAMSCVDTPVAGQPRFVVVRCPK
jgi:hypothetical protein